MRISVRRELADGQGAGSDEPPELAPELAVIGTLLHGLHFKKDAETGRFYLCDMRTGGTPHADKRAAVLSWISFVRKESFEPMKRSLQHHGLFLGRDAATV